MNQYIHTSARITALLFFLIGFSVASVQANNPESTSNIVFTPTFYRGLNLNGAAVSLDGNSWQASSGAANFSYVGSTFANQNVTLIPSTDATRATMIRSSIWGNVTLNLTSVPNGYYDI